MNKRKLIKKSSLIPTVLIYGGSTFIGYHIAKSFLLKKSRVIYIDSPGNIENSKIKELVNNKNFALFSQSDYQDIPQEIKEVDYIVYIGDLESAFIDYRNTDLKNMLANSNLLKRLLDLANYSKAKFLFLSPLFILNSSNLKKGENYNFIELYKFSEALILEFAESNQCDIKILRLPYIYGPDISFESSGALGEFMKDLLNNNSLSIYGDENRFEKYINVHDAVSICLKVLFKPQSDIKVFNLVQDDSHKVLSTCFLLKNLSNKITDIEYKETTKDYINFNFDNSINTYDWNQKYSLKEGVTLTLDYYGYKVSESSFKPNDLVKQKQKNSNSTDTIYSTDYTNNNLPNKNITESISTSVKKSNFIYSFYKKITDFFNTIFTNISNIKIKKPTKDIIEKETINLKINKSENNKFSKIKINGVYLIIFFTLLISFISIFVVFPIISFNLSLNKAYKNLMSAKENIYSYNLIDAQNNIKNASNEIQKIRVPLSKSKWIFTIYLGNDGYKSLVNSINSIAHFIKSTDYVLLAAQPFENTLEVIHPDSNSYFDSNNINQSVSYLFTAKNEINLSKSNFDYVDKNSLPKYTHKYYDTYESYLDTYSILLQDVSIALSDLDSLLGLNEVKNYILWFQNSNELRPTGGFIGSYGLLTIDKGKIAGLYIDDIYNPDGQIDILDINQPIPQVLQENLNEDRMHLRNSNWDIDFTKSAKEFTDLYYRATGTKVDGVIALDLYFVKNILKDIGPVYLASYDEQINADNLYERTQFYSDFKYENGVSDKKNFLTSLSSKITESIFSLDSSESKKLYNSIKDSLVQRHLLIHIENNSINTLLDKNKLNGKILNTNSDFLYINNANIGGTKSNYYVKNNYDYTVMSKTRDGKLRSELTLNYNHTGLDTSWPGGPYKNYIRVIRNKGTLLTDAIITLDNQETKTDIINDVIIEEEGDFVIYSYLLELQPQQKLTMTLKFDISEDFNFSKSFMNYKFYWQKQPGTHDDIINVKINPPFGSNVENIETNLNNSLDDKLQYSDNLNTDKFLNVKFN